MLVRQSVRLNPHLRTSAPACRVCAGVSTWLSPRPNRVLLGFDQPLYRISQRAKSREAGNRTPSAWSQARRATVTLHPGGEGQDRTVIFRLRAGRSPIELHPHAWNCGELNPGPPRCHRGALPTELQSHAVPRPEPIAPVSGRRYWMGGDTELLVVLARAHANPSRVGHLWCITLWNCQPACTGHARSPVGGAPAGMAGLEPAPRSVGSCCSGR
jgi:hypothetical protein